MAEKRTYTKRNTAPAPIPANEFGKLPPQAPELEEAILGAIMIEKDAYSLVAEILRADCFYKIAHQKIYEAITSLAIHQEPIDMHTVTEQLRKSGTLDDVGGPYYITLLTAKVSSAAHLEYHSRIVVQKYLARELIRISSEIQTKAFDDKADVNDLMEEAEGMLFEVTQQNLKKDATQINPVIEEARNRMILAANKEGASGVASGFHALDKITSGWQRSDLIIIAARPAMGKTAFVLSMAKNMAVDYNTPVAVFSLEMSNVQLVNRMIMNVCQLEGDKIKKGDLSLDEWEIFDKRIKTLMDAPIFVDDTPSLSVFELRSKARRLVKEHKVECIIIDYLQLMNASGMNFGSREQEVSMISRSLKGLAKELDIPIIALSQLNRGVEGRTGLEGKRPQLSDLRESGAIEQDADMVCFIHRPEYYHLTEDNQGNSLIGIAEIIIAKHRNGATDTVRLRFKNIYTRFANLDDIDDEDENIKSLNANYHSFSSKMNAVTEGSFYGDSALTPIPPADLPRPFEGEGNIPDKMPF
ncbi:replicative DNA helicase [Paludibacter sp. 221]|uniref:replicative DNA helicase n=1 Tax=Paludibacter sp. 221 TaxID=2302939 RepID=UPI0013D6E14B|nr:replicative DNA helicase [Paludibacter sp. 221]NDV47908.1 replicative DNA helicase [Paludibacter sp. 221]